MTNQDPATMATTPPVTGNGISHHCYKQLLIGWKVGVYWEMTEDQGPTTNDGDTSTNHGDGQHTTRPQLRKQLLVGWMAGGMLMTTGNRDGDDDDDDSSIQDRVQGLTMTWTGTRKMTPRMTKSPSTPHDNE